MKVLHVIQGLDPATGGPAYAIRHIAYWQRALGAQVSVLATTARTRSLPNSTPEELEAYQREPAFEGVDLHFCRPITIGPLGRTWGFVPNAHAAFDHACESRGFPDIVHIHGVFSAIVMSAAHWARRRGIPYACRPAGSVNRACLDLGHSWLKRSYLRLSYMADLRQAAILHAASSDEALALKTLVPDAASAIRVIPHGAQFDCCDRERFRESFLAAHPQLASRRIVLFLSRVTAKKRPEMLVMAAARMQVNHPEMALVIAGSGDSHEQELQRAIAVHRSQDRVLRLDHLEGRARCEAFAAADAFVLPSIDENFGIAVVEAMAHGVPAVVTPGVATHHYVDECRGGVTVSDSVEGLADGIERVLYGDLQDAGSRARDFAKRRLSWRDTAERLMNEYRECARSSQLSRSA